jgi:hypothetical protein
MLIEDKIQLQIDKRGSHTLRHTQYFHKRQKHLEARLDGAKDDVELKQLIHKIGSPTF